MENLQLLTEKVIHKPLDIWEIIKETLDEFNRYKPGAVEKPSNRSVSTESTNDHKKGKRVVQNKLTKQNVSSTDLESKSDSDSETHKKNLTCNICPSKPSFSNYGNRHKHISEVHNGVY